MSAHGVTGHGMSGHSAKARPAPGGGRIVDIPPARLAGWVNRFAARNSGITAMVADGAGVMITATDGTSARLEVPFPPMSVGEREPVEAVLDHCAGIGAIGMILVRAGAHSVGICRDGVVSTSSTDTHYVQGRTAAGGWSQQRYARRRGNQLSAARESTADAAARVLSGQPLAALVVGGDLGSITAVLGDPRLKRLITLPRREFRDIVEPRRVVLDDVARRCLEISITVRNAPAL